MPTLEERVAYLEGRVEEHSRAWEDIKDHLIHIDQKVDRFRDELSERINALDQKVDRFRDELSGRIQSLEERMEKRIHSLEERFSRYFIWIFGIQITILITILAVFLRSL